MRWLFLWLTVSCTAVLNASAEFFKFIAFEPQGRLVWTNLLCTTRPVYEAFSAPAPTGPWEHLAFVTNQTSLLVGDPAGNGSSRFYRIKYIDDAPLRFDYAFDEGYGVVAVEGQINISLPQETASWDLVETDYVIDGSHPVGRGIGPAYLNEDGTILWVFLTQAADDTFYLGGLLNRSGAPGHCSYSSYAGQVFWVNFGGTESIGTFLAMPAP
jgi:hypothetical protein